VDLSEGEREELAALPFDEARYLREVGSACGVGEAGYSLLERQWARPTLEVNGLWGGYEGEGSKTVIPSRANGKISCRLVPEQDPHDIAGKLARHLVRHAPAGTRVTVESGGHSAPPYRIPSTHVGLLIAEQALRDVYGKTPLRVRMGATLPVCDLFRRHLHAETIPFSFSTADEDFHAPNEYFRLHRIEEGIIAWARYWHLLSIQGVTAARGGSKR
jgi:acetylornithine deacetylase/succinyl-diaminopimelate desuccinylase-like protein